MLPSYPHLPPRHIIAEWVAQKMPWLTDEAQREAVDSVLEGIATQADMPRQQEGREMGNYNRDYLQPDIAFDGTAWLASLPTATIEEATRLNIPDSVRENIEPTKWFQGEHGKLYTMTSGKVYRWITNHPDYPQGGFAPPEWDWESGEYPNV